MKYRSESKKMVLEFLDELPTFCGRDQDGTDVKIEDDIAESWYVIFSYPADFTPICTTEISEFARAQEQFAKRNCRIIGISSDSIDSHRAWISDIQTLSNAEIKFPIIADEDGSVLSSLGLLMHSRSGNRTKRARAVSPLRGLYIIDPERRVQFVQIMPQSTGRNLSEIIRVLDSLQLSRMQRHLGTPAGWEKGQDAVLLSGETIQNEEGKPNASEHSVFTYLKFVQVPAEV